MVSSGGTRKTLCNVTINAGNVVCAYVQLTRTPCDHPQASAAKDTLEGQLQLTKDREIGIVIT